MKRCRDCRREIYFTRLRTGAAVPVESPEPEVHYLKLQEAGAPQVRVVMDGEVLAGRRVTRFESGACRLEGFEVHTCR